MVDGKLQAGCELIPLAKPLLDPRKTSFQNLNHFPHVPRGQLDLSFAPGQAAKLRGRKRWIAFFHHPRGTVFVDAGAKRALIESGRSLLPPGVTRCAGEFVAGDIVSICGADGAEFARGIARFGSAEIDARKTARGEVVHRDDLVIL